MSAFAALFGDMDDPDPNDHEYDEQDEQEEDFPEEPEDLPREIEKEWDAEEAMNIEEESDDSR